MTDQTSSRHRVVLLIVLGVIAVALGAMLLIGILKNDETDQINPQNGEIITLLR